MGPRRAGDATICEGADRAAARPHSFADHTHLGSAAATVPLTDHQSGETTKHCAPPASAAPSSTLSKRQTKCCSRRQRQSQLQRGRHQCHDRSAKLFPRPLQLDLGKRRQLNRIDRDAYEIIPRQTPQKRPPTRFYDAFHRPFSPTGGGPYPGGSGGGGGRGQRRVGRRQCSSALRGPPPDGRGAAGRRFRMAAGRT